MSTTASTESVVPATDASAGVTVIARECEGCSANSTADFEPTIAFAVYGVEEDSNFNVYHKIEETLAFFTNKSAADRYAETIKGGKRVVDLKHKYYFRGVMTHTSSVWGLFPLYCYENNKIIHDNGIRFFDYLSNAMYIAQTEYTTSFVYTNCLFVKIYLSNGWFSRNFSRAELYIPRRNPYEVSLLRSITLLRKIFQSTPTASAIPAERSTPSASANAAERIPSASAIPAERTPAASEDVEPAASEDVKPAASEVVEPAASKDVEPAANSTLKRQSCFDSNDGETDESKPCAKRPRSPGYVSSNETVSQT